MKKISLIVLALFLPLSTMLAMKNFKTPKKIGTSVWKKNLQEELKTKKPEFFSRSWSELLGKGKNNQGSRQFSASTEISVEGAKKTEKNRRVMNKQRALEKNLEEQRKKIAQDEKMLKKIGTAKERLQDEFPTYSVEGDLLNPPQGKNISNVEIPEYEIDPITNEPYFRSEETLPEIRDDESGPSREKLKTKKPGFFSRSWSGLLGKGKNNQGKRQFSTSSRGGNDASDALIELQKTQTPEQNELLNNIQNIFREEDKEILDYSNRIQRRSSNPNEKQKKEYEKRDAQYTLNMSQKYKQLQEEQKKLFDTYNYNQKKLYFKMLQQKHEKKRALDTAYPEYTYEGVLTTPIKTAKETSNVDNTPYKINPMTNESDFRRDDTLPDMTNTTQENAAKSDYYNIDPFREEKQIENKKRTWYKPWTWGRK